MLAFSIKGFDYQCEPLNAREQFHVLRRLSPALAELASAVQNDADVEGTLKSLGKSLAGLSDADADYCLFSLLKNVSRKQQNAGWVKITVDQNVMFPDLTMVDLLQIAAKSFQCNFGDFFGELPDNILAMRSGSDKSLG